MAKEKNRLKLWLWVVVILAIIAGGYFYLNSYFNVKINKHESESVSASNAKLFLSQKQKDSVISTLQQLKKFGDWPVGIVGLSAGRGSPFQEKNIQIEP